METRRGDSSFPRLLLVQGPHAERLRRRCAAVAAAVLFVSCFLVAVGLALLVPVVVGAPALLAVAWAARADGRLRARVARVRVRCRTAGSVVLLRARLLAERARASAGARRPDPDAAVPDDAEATVEMVAVAASSGGRTVYGRPPLPTRAQLAAAFPQLLPALERRIHDALAGDPATAGPAPGPLELEGSRCNALGVELRRAGRAQQAATLHEAARLIYAEAGDSRGEALAANALGVALAELGDDDAALLQFEQARTLLHELGDRHWEGKVLANVGLAKQRAGRDEEAVDLLRDALAKLSPESEAYRLVEQRLLRAR